ncbi:hypothetical protein RD792_016785 [Penstemon davidsonii]|uniref:Protein kinase domain-containing protein n=1 Tax=Penstemon davidsonii TaxID=160366 RepID=A0ABR0CLY6_9LAMI|nr:hypothetical protein RD792_016785 [Penstemon davidsonii]
MTCGTLADHLYKHARDSDNDSSLTWKQRLNICIGAGRGLDYLHTGHGIIHRDVKSSNILLDENFISKVSDFGLAKPEDRNKLQSHVSTKVKGTHGYIDPYYVRFSKLTTKSDTYAFGVVLLEVLCGRPAMDRRLGEDECFITKWALNRINKGEVEQIVDSSLVGEITANSLKVFVEIAESCLHDEPKKQPAMAQVVLQLELALEQQETRKDAIPNQITKVDDETTLPVSTEQPTVASSESIERGKDQRVNTEPPPANKDGRKPKMYKSPRFWVLDALWKRVKVSRNEEIVPNFLSDSVSLSSPNFNAQLAYDIYIMKYVAEIYEAGSKLSEYDFATIAAATNQFSVSNKIGQGGYGPVYKGVLPTGQMVAVKRLSQNQFKSVIPLISNLQHRNIIKLLGYCIHEEPLLLYEFMENGSLNTHIFDFGFAKTLEDDQSEVETTVVGNIGYLDPEYLVRGIASFTSDIYTLGIVILEIVSGRRIGQIRLDECIQVGLLSHLVDESIEGAFSEEEALRCIQVSLLCIQPNRNHRPTISSVLKMLLGEELPLETQEKVVKAAAGHKVNFRYISASNSVSDNSESPPLANETFQKDDHNVMTNPFNWSAATFENDNTLSPLLNPLIDSSSTFEFNHTPDPLTNPSIDNDATFEYDDINTPKYVQ